MRVDTYDLDVPTGDNFGVALPVEDYNEKTVQVTGVFTGSLAIHGSIDGTNFDAITSSITSEDIVASRLGPISTK